MKLSRIIPFLTVLCTVILPLLIFGSIQNSEGSTISSLPSTEPSTTESVNAFRISVIGDDGLIEEMDLEDYILCVILREMPADFELEALKAQAVVARTYTLRRCENGGKHEFAAVCTEPSCCQGYCDPSEYLNSGGEELSIEKIRRAVSETSGVVLTYNGELAEATYFSCSGGQTEDAQAVWGTNIPYLKSTESPGEEGATHFTDTVTFDADAIETLLNIDLSMDFRKWVGPVTYTKGGGVDTIEIGGKTFRGVEMRRVLGLKSTAFQIAVVGNRFIITTRGFGHRVGMSQYGAEAMAVGGKNYEEILRHYYEGTELKCIGN